jgi:hypothetical protein
MGGTYNTKTRPCNLIIVPCSQLLCMVIVDATNNFDDLKLRTISMEEYNILLSRIYQQYSPIYTNWDDNRLPYH